MIEKQRAELATEQLIELLRRLIKQSKGCFCIKESMNELLSSMDKTIKHSKGRELFSLLALVNDVSLQVFRIIVNELSDQLTEQEEKTLLTAFEFNTHRPFLTNDTVRELSNKSFAGIKVIDSLTEWISSQESSFVSTFPIETVEVRRVYSLLDNDAKGLALLSRLKTNDRFDEELLWNFIEGEFCYELVIKLMKELGLSIIAKLLTVRCD